MIAIMHAIFVAAVITLSLVSLAHFQQSADDLNNRNCNVLHLLNVQPLTDLSEFSGFDGGLDLIPAAHLAAEEINNSSDILQGFKLKVVDIDSEACGRDTIIKGLINLYRVVTQDPRQCIVGVMGFPCSTVTSALVPISGHQNIGYVTLANSGSPAHRNITQYPNLFHTISSTSVHNKALILLMQRFNWRRIGVVYDSMSIFFRTTAKDFIQRVDNHSEVKLAASVPISNSADIINEAFDIINAEEVRISYWLGNDGQNALCLCEAYHRQLTYPGYVYIMRYNPKIIENLLEAETECSEDELLQAMERVFLLDYRLQVDDDTVLESGWNYGEFRQRYADRLEEYAQITNNSLQVSIYGNSFYDQVWTFARAINNSLPSIHSGNLSFSDYTFGKTETISRIIRHELMNLSFQGATGRIKFDDNRSIPSSVDIMQIQNGEAVLIGIYDPFCNNITRQKFPENIPDDTFQTFYILLPPWLGGCILVGQIILLCLITTNMVLLLWWRGESEIKASGPILSISIMVGCYLLCAASIILAVKEAIIVHDMTLLTFLCNLKLWSFWIGVDLIFATLLLRLLRLFHLFRTFRRTGKLWSDKYLFLYLLLICLGKVALLSFWTYFDTFRPEINHEYVPSATPPHYQVSINCNIEHGEIWLLVTYLYSGILMVFVMFLATQTRHIKKEHFKDIKKVNLFIFLVIIFLATTLPLWIIFGAIGIEIGVHLCEWLAYFSAAMLCQLCLFTPKLLPLAVKKIMCIRSHPDHSQSRKKQSPIIHTSTSQYLLWHCDV